MRTSYESPSCRLDAPFTPPPVLGKLDFSGFLRALKLVCQKIEEKRKDLTWKDVSFKEVEFKDILECVLERYLLPLVHPSP